MRDYIRFKGTVTYKVQYSFDETDFNRFVKEYNISGITYRELLDVFEGKIEDLPIQLGKDLFIDDGKPIYALDFFTSLVETRCLDEDVTDDDDLDVYLESKTVRQK